MRKTLESYVFTNYEEMIASVMGMQDMLEIFFFLQRVPEGLGEEL